jgi:Protein of unknown function (DUF3175)
MPATKKKRRWSHKIKTVSTFPPPGTFKKKAASIAKIMASKKVSPKGISSGIKMVQMYINRAGKNLEADQKKELEKAKRILQKKKARQAAGTKRKKAKKSPSRTRSVKPKQRRSDKK